MRVGELRRVVAGQSPKSLAAQAKLNRICTEHLPGRHTIEVIDLGLQPQLAAVDRVLALPMLVSNFSEPVRKRIGDLSDTRGVLIGLDIKIEE
jgi:circadian clock protein KaiB